MIHCFLFKLCSKLDHPGIATLIAAHAKPPNYMFFFKLYESQNLAQKLHVEEWIPTLNDALMMAMQLGIVVILSILIDNYLARVCFSYHIVGKKL